MYTLLSNIPSIHQVVDHLIYLAARMPTQYRLPIRWAGDLLEKFFFFLLGKFIGTHSFVNTLAICSIRSVNSHRTTPRGSDCAAPSYSSCLTCSSGLHWLFAMTRFVFLSAFLKGDGMTLESGKESTMQILMKSYVCFRYPSWTVYSLLPLPGSQLTSPLPVITFYGSSIKSSPRLRPSWCV